jgi:hypothetical protein
LFIEISLYSFCLQGSKRPRTWTSKIWKTKARRLFETPGTAQPMKQRHEKKKKNHSSSKHVGKYVKQCSRNDGIFLADMNVTFH